MRKWHENHQIATAATVTSTMPGPLRADEPCVALTHNEANVEVNFKQHERVQIGITRTWSIQVNLSIQASCCAMLCSDRSTPNLACAVPRHVCVRSRWGNPHTESCMHVWMLFTSRSSRCALLLCAFLKTCLSLGFLHPEHYQVPFPTASGLSGLSHSHGFCSCGRVGDSSYSKAVRIC